MNILEKIRELIVHNLEDDALKELKVFVQINTLPIFFSRSIIVLQSRLNKYEEDVILAISDTTTFNQIIKDILDLTERIATWEIGTKNSINALNDKIILDFQFPYVGRDQFRKEIKRALLGADSKIIFVKGEPKSGLSYIQNYLYHICKNNDYLELISYNIRTLDVPGIDKGVYLASELSKQIGLSFSIEENTLPQFKYTTFTTKLKEKLSIHEKTMIIFLHDFHGITNGSGEFRSFVSTIAEAVKGDFSKIVFVLSGFDEEQLQNWDTDLKFLLNRFSLYQMEIIEKDTFRDCLKTTFSIFRTEIETINEESLTEEEYINGMLEKIASDSVFNLPGTAHKMKIQLNELINRRNGIQP